MSNLILSLVCTGLYASFAFYSRIYASKTLKDCSKRNSIVVMDYTENKPNITRYTVYHYSIWTADSSLQWLEYYGIYWLAVCSFKQFRCRWQVSAYRTWTRMMLFYCGQRSRLFDRTSLSVMRTKLQKVETDLSEISTVDWCRRMVKFWAHHTHGSWIQGV